VSGLGDGRSYHRFRRPLLVPYAFPVYVGGYGYSGYADPGYAGYYAPEQQPDVNAVNPPQVVINQNFIPEHATPVMHEYSQDFSGVQVYQAPGRESAGSAEEDTTNSYYLLAFKDHSIYSAFAYWVEGDTLHYVTPQRVHNQASLSLVDRELTERLNRDRSMQVKLPK
jgi:signal peptidase I